MTDAMPPEGSTKPGRFGEPQTAAPAQNAPIGREVDPWFYPPKPLGRRQTHLCRNEPRSLLARPKTARAGGRLDARIADRHFNSVAGNDDSVLDDIALDDVRALEY